MSRAQPCRHSMNIITRSTLEARLELFTGACLPSEHVSDSLWPLKDHLCRGPALLFTLHINFTICSCPASNQRKKDRFGLTCFSGFILNNALKKVWKKRRKHNGKHETQSESRACVLHQVLNSLSEAFGKKNNTFLLLCIPFLCFRSAQMCGPAACSAAHETEKYIIATHTAWICYPCRAPELLELLYMALMNHLKRSVTQHRNLSARTSQN